MSISRRDLLGWFAVAPVLPKFIVDTGVAAAQGGATGQPIVVVVRMLGGNDGINTVVPVRDDRYYRLRPTIALTRNATLSVSGSDMALHPDLVDVQRLMDDGIAGIVQGVGYPQSSRSHLRATEIWETGSVADAAPEAGWLGRYLDHACDCSPAAPGGIHFGNELARTLVSHSLRASTIGSPQLLLEMSPEALEASKRGPRSGRFDYLRQVENSLAATTRLVRQARQGSGGTFGYPATPFGQSLRWAGDMIETGARPRVFYVTIGSFDTPASASFDTHVDQLPKHRLLFKELGQGLRAFAAHLKRTGHLERTLLLTFSDFGRMAEENRTGGTEHGDASVLFYMGGAVRPGLLGQPVDFDTLKNGAVPATVDFRSIYADVLREWLQVEPGVILEEPEERFGILANG